MMKTSQAGLAAIMQREGLRTHAYLDSVGVWTIGVGHTGRMSGPHVTPGMVISRAQALSFLSADLAPVELVINKSISPALNQNQFDALASLGFNIGAHGLQMSTVVHMINLHRFQSAADAFLMWEHPPQLKGRREAERKQFLEVQNA